MARSERVEMSKAKVEDRQQQLKTKWAVLKALVWIEKQVRMIAEDLVQHFERRLEATDGKAMVVCMSRRGCVDLYDERSKLRTDWNQIERIHCLNAIVRSARLLSSDFGRQKHD